MIDGLTGEGNRSSRESNSGRLVGSYYGLRVGAWTEVCTVSRQKVPDVVILTL